MADDVIVNKIAAVERCIRRIQEDYDADRTNFTKQDAVILNLERACQACIDIAAHVVKSRKLGIPQTTRDLFSLLAEHQQVPLSLAENLPGMVSFRSIAVHDYASLNLDIVASIVEKHLTDFSDFTTILLKKEG